MFLEEEKDTAYMKMKASCICEEIGGMCLGREEIMYFRGTSPHLDRDCPLHGVESLAVANVENDVHLYYIIS
jgi:hypothetical protein